MPKKVVNIVKKDKKEKTQSESKELFNLNEEIIIGINSKNVVKKENTKNNSKNVKNSSRNKKKSKSNKNRNKTNKEKKSHKILKIFIILFLLLISIVLILLSPLFNIKSIVVKNNNLVSKEEIISLSQINMDDNIFKYLNIDIMKNVEANPYIEEVNIIRKYPSQIIIEVQEREIEYILKINETYVYIDNQGYILEVTSEEYKSPEIIGYKTEAKDILAGNRLIEEDLLKLENINLISNYAKENELNDKILSYNIEDDTIAISLVGEKVAYIEDFTNLNIKMLSLKVILERTEGKPGEIFLDGQGENSAVLFREKV